MRPTAESDAILRGMSARKFLCLFLLAAALGIAGCVLPSSTPMVSFTVEALTAASVRVSAPSGWARYEWHFGDGTTAEGETVTHVYDEPGEYAIDLKVLGGDGEIAFKHRIVSVHRDIYVSVSPDLPRDYASLQLAVDAAEPGDMIFVEGEHIGNVVIDKAIAIRGPCTLVSVSENPAAYGHPAIYVSVDGVSLEEITFEGGGEEATAGGALRLESAAIEVVGCTFDGHTGYSGGAVYAMESAALFSDCTFSDNRADVDGGAVYCEGDQAFPTFLRCTFSDNRADAGAGIAVRATTYVSVDAVPLRVEDCTFEQNLAGGLYAGGAIHVGHACRTVLDGNTYSANGLRDVVYE